MIPLATSALELKRRIASDVIPTWLVGLLAGFQVVLWLLIIILESVSVYYSATYGTVYAGFWCSTIFFTTWISMFCFLCCEKTNCCGIYLIVINTIALLFSIILVSFTAIFVADPCECYLPYCNTFSWETCDDRFTQPKRKLPYLKGLLACSIIMLVTNLIYVVTYIAISIWLCKRANTELDSMNAMYQNQSGNIGFTSQQQQQQQQQPLQQQPLQQQFIPYPMNYPPQMVQQQYAPYLINGGYCQPQLQPQPPLLHQPTPQKGNVEDERL